jgi:tripartite ATP-independent transporter DctM subunit
MAVLPIAEIGLRAAFETGIPGAIPIVQHLTLWVGFLGAAMAAREGKLLALATASFLPKGRARTIANVLAASFGVFVSGLLARAGWELVTLLRDNGTEVTRGIPAWTAVLVLPVSFAAIAVRMAWRAAPSWIVRAGLLAAAALGYIAGVRHEAFADTPFWPWALFAVVAAVVGAPIFAVLGGIAAILFMIDGNVPALVPVETYRLAVSPSLPAIPLFTLAGFLLAEGRSSERLLAVFRALVGWLPGGTAVVTVAVCAFFTAFTGGSGVTILALGGLLFPALLKERYREEFSLGLLTSSGSLGLLFPPALPLILYGIVAQVRIEDLFLGGILPGLLMVVMLAAWAVREGLRSGNPTTPFRLQEAKRAVWAAKFELLVPVIALIALFSGYATLIEASAVTALYVLIAQVFVHRDVSIVRDLPRALRECCVLLGGVLIILGVAMGLTNWLIDAQVPMRLLEWVQAKIDSPLLFLLALNVFLLVVGCLMDIFSAIVVVVPLIVPLGEAFGIHPVHLGIIFVANLELGYLTPPVGLNLFLSSYRFERPLLEVYRSVVPALIILGAGVLLITYLPPLTLTLVHLFGGG